MTNQCPTSNRRSFLSGTAAVAAGAVVAIPAVSFASAPSRSAWDATMARFLREEAAADHYDKSTWRPAFVNYKDSKTPIPRHIEEEYDRLASAADDTRWELMYMPAPDKVALRWKLDHLLKDDSTGSVASWSVEHLDQTVADYRRLLGEA